MHVPAGESVAFTVDDEKGGRGEGMRVFAGLRSDPFFLDGIAIAQTIQTGRLALKEAGTNGVYNSNILSIVLDVECAALLDGGHSPPWSQRRWQWASGRSDWSARANARTSP